MTWYVCRVVSRQEKRIVASLEEKGLTAYCPLQTTWAKNAVRKATTARALSPGYVFVMLPDDAAINAVRSDRRVKSIMCDGAGRPKRIATGELRGIFILEMFHAFDETWEPPRAKGKRYSHRWKPGEQVRITKGPYADWKGYVSQAKGKAMVIMLRAFGRDVPVTVPHADLQAVATQDIAELVAA